MKRPFAMAAAALVLASTFAAQPAFAQDRSFRAQIAAARANRAVVLQGGSGNGAAIAQNGAGNNAGVVQAGRNNTGAITQDGNNNTGCLVQFGSGLDGSIAQTGNNSRIGVLQGNRGYREIPADSCTRAANSAIYRGLLGTR